MASTTSDDLEAKRMRVQLKPWRRLLARAFLSMNETQATELAYTRDFPIEDYVTVRIDELRAAVAKPSKEQVSATEAQRKLEADARAKVRTVLEDVFGPEAALVHLSVATKGALLEDDFYEYDGENTPEAIAKAFPNTEQNFSYRMVFRVGEGPNATLSYVLHIKQTLEAHTGRVYVLDWADNKVHPARAHEDFSALYPELAVDVQGETFLQRMHTLAEDVASFLGVWDWVLQGHTALTFTHEGPLPQPNGSVVDAVDESVLDVVN
jgi:hypothetical protein